MSAYDKQIAPWEETGNTESEEEMCKTFAE
jgi:hypothetical protein